jgi:uncharacterized damage-inducible protein DinB
VSINPAAPSSLSPHQRHFVRLAQYNAWFNGELFRHASTLDDAERKLDRFAAELTPELLASDVTYRNTRGLTFTNPLWHVVAHVFNHGTHHRGQVTTLLLQAGVDPGPTDFLITAMMPFPGAD